MPERVVIIDYQMSNLFSVRHACEHVGGRAVISSDRREVARAEALILPGVGAFKDAMRNLARLDLIGPIKDAVAEGRPFLGVCLGLQLLFDGSEEFGGSEGLGIVPGQVRRFPETVLDGDPLKVPHIGWNGIDPAPGAAVPWTDSPCRSMTPGEHVYFVHSYYVIPERAEDAFALTEYRGFPFCSAAARGNIFATQFHPEKSGLPGLTIYRNWIQAVSGPGR